MDIFGARAEEIFAKFGGRENVEGAFQSGPNGMALLINHQGVENREKARARAEAARNQGETAQELRLARHMNLQDTHVRSHLSHCDHDHAQCIRQLRLAAQRAGKG